MLELHLWQRSTELMRTPAYYQYLSIIKIIINPLKDFKDFKVDPGQHQIRAAVSFSSLAFAEAWSSLSESAAANELSNIASCCSSSISLAVCCWICDSASDSLACEDSWGIIQGIPRSTGHQVNMVTTWDMMRLGMAGFLFTTSENDRNHPKSSQNLVRCWIAKFDALARRIHFWLRRALTWSLSAAPPTGSPMTLSHLVWFRSQCDWNRANLLQSPSVNYPLNIFQERGSKHQTSEL